MQSNNFLDLLKKHKESSLYHRYINNDNVLPLLQNLNNNFEVDNVGYSVNNEPIFSITIGAGSKRILMWSQMHGNESTTTKALFDVMNILNQSNWFSEEVLKNCTLKIIPILNPDGARLYTRLNANNIDLNRDAQEQSQPESAVLLDVFNKFTPDFCFNLHGQRTIFSAGKFNNPATISFLAPAQDQNASITETRKCAMEIVVKMNDLLKQVIPDQIGIYDDSFNINCVGDTFQTKNTPTILFEAGHFKEDYSRERVREYLGLSLMAAFNYIANTEISGAFYGDYFKIPKNEKLFYDIIIRNAKLGVNDDVIDVAIQYQEVLIDDEIKFNPMIEKIGVLNSHFGHLEINAKSKMVESPNNEKLYQGYANDFVLINDELFALNGVNS
jgi:hypothetical protein